MNRLTPEPLSVAQAQALAPGLDVHQFPPARVKRCVTARAKNSSWRAARRTRGPRTDTSSPAWSSSLPAARNSRSPGAESTTREGRPCGCRIRSMVPNSSTVFPTEAARRL